MKKVYFTLGILFIHCAVFAQKDKLPKLLKSEWILEYSNTLDDLRKNRITFLNDKINWEGDPYRTIEFENYQYNEEGVVYDTVTATSEPETYTGPLSQDSNELILKSHKAGSPTQGVLVAEYNDYGYRSYVVLSYQNLSKTSVDIFLKYGISSLKEAEKLASDENFHDPLLQRTYLNKSTNQLYHKYPSISIIDQRTYQNWWDAYLAEIKKPEIKSEMEKRNIPARLNLADGEYFTVKLLQDLFVKSNYNPFSSLDALRNALSMYGINEEIRTKIRGSYTSDERDQIKKELERNWYSFILPPPYGMDSESRLSTKLSLQNNKLVLSRSYFPGFIANEAEKVEDKGKMQTENMELDIIDYVKGMTSHDGFVAVGPFPDTLVYDNKSYAILLFQFVKPGLYFFTFGDMYSSKEEAINSPIRSENWGAIAFVEESKALADADLPVMPVQDEEEMVRLNEKVDQKLKEISDKSIPENQYRILFMYDYIYQLGFSPIKTLVKIAKFEQIKYNRDMLAGYQSDLEYYQSQINSIPPDSIDPSNSKASLENTKINIEIAKLDIDLLGMELRGDTTGFLAKRTLLEAYKAFQEVIYKIQDFESKIQEVTDLKKTVVNLDKKSEYFESDYNYYLERYNTEISHYPTQLSDSLKVIESEMKSFSEKKAPDLFNQLSTRFNALDYQEDRLLNEIAELKKVLDEKNK